MPSKSQSVGRASSRDRALLIGLVIVLATMVMFPFVWLLLMSFKTDADILSTTPKFIFTPTFDNYSALWQGNFPRSFLNSAIVSVTSTALAMVFGVPAAYALSRMSIRAERPLSLLILCSRMAPPIAFTIPYFLAYRYMGLTDIGQPKVGETVVVGAATGPVGTVVGQVAKILGCQVVGVAGGAEKCEYAVKELGFDACIDHKDPTLAEKLAAACPTGIDVYFENVGGKVFDAVMPLLNAHARVPLCGLIAQYNATSLPEGPDRLPQLMRLMLSQRIRMQGFIIFDNYGHCYPDFLKTMTPWVAEGRVRVKEDRVEGLENAPDAFIGLLEGKNFGKLVVKIAD